MHGGVGRDSAISRDELLNAVRLIVSHLKQKDEVTEQEIKELLQSKDEGHHIPLQLFEHEKLSSLEIVSKYLHENKNLSFRQIGQLLQRDERTIWTTVKNARKKLSTPFITTAPAPSFPAHILTNRNYSVLEAIVLHLSHAYSVRELARLLRKPYSTIWVTLQKARRKAHA
jgi:DNA-directed RNA polymerase specialized sigma24 family protein